MPGIAASTSETWLFGSPPNSVEAPENSFEFEVTWAWTSSPITISQSPVAPLISLRLSHSCCFRLPSSAETIRSHSVSSESVATGWPARRYQ